MSTVGGGFGDPATIIIAVTPADDTDLTGVRGLYVNGAGNLVLRTIHNPSNSVTMAVQAGALIPVQVTRVMAATTATGITALK